MTTVTITVTASQTITIPSHVKMINVTCKGAGGGGHSGMYEPPYQGLGGSEGATENGSSISVIPGGQYAIVIGTKGIGGRYNQWAAPTPGGATSAFGVSAGGGAAGGVDYTATKGGGTSGGAAGTQYGNYNGGNAGGYGCGGGGGYSDRSTMGTGGDGSDGAVFITYQQPDITISATPTEDTAPAEVAFLGSVTESPTSFAWSFGDGGSSSVQNPSHTYTVPGKFTVSLTVTNAYCTVTQTKTEYISMYWEPTTQIYFLMADPRGP